MSALPSRLQLMKTSDRDPLRPFLRWAGGKRKLLPTLLSLIPEDFSTSENRVYEPFLGGGAFSIALGASGVSGKLLYLNDMNQDLVMAYKAIRDEPDVLMKKLSKMATNLDALEYDAVRAARPKDDLSKAARFIYLNRTCFNGLWRVNSSGDFNVPFGKLDTPTIFDPLNISALSELLHRSTITNIGFAGAVESARPKDLVYMDPPYMPLTQTASFSAYARDGFGILDHYALAGVIRGLTIRGVKVILSNSDTPETREIFGSVLDLHMISVARSISANASSRGNVGELIGINYQIPGASALANNRIGPQ